MVNGVSQIQNVGLFKGSNLIKIAVKVGDYDKRAISKTTLRTTPELFRGLIQAIWRKN